MRKKQHGQEGQRKRRPLVGAADRRLARGGQRLYDAKLKALLEPAYMGMFAAIEVNSGDYFVATDMAEAVEKAEARTHL